MNEINQNVKNLIELSRCNNLTFDQFQSIINFEAYDLMVTVLGDTPYPNKYDYTFMAPHQAESIELIEQMTDIRREFVDKVDTIARENLKKHCLKEYPDKVHLIDWCDLNWSNLKAVYNMYHNNFEIPVSL